MWFFWTYTGKLAVREAGGARQLLAGGDLDVLVGDHVLHLHVLFHHGVLHQDAVADDGALLDLDAAEQHAVLHGALDGAAVSQQGVGHLAARHIAGGVVVADLGVDGAVLGEQGIQVLLVQQLHVLVEVALHVADVGDIAGVLNGVDVQDVDVVGQDIPLEVDQAASGGVLDQGRGGNRSAAAR